MPLNLIFKSQNWQTYCVLVLYNTEEKILTDSATIKRSAPTKKRLIQYPEGYITYILTTKTDVCKTDHKQVRLLSEIFFKCARESTIN